MTMSMYSSYTPEDFNNIEEDIFGEYGTQIASGFRYVQLCPIDRAFPHIILQTLTNLSRKYPHRRREGLLHATVTA